MHSFWQGFEKQAGSGGLKKLVAQHSWNPVANSTLKERVGRMLTKHLQTLKNPEKAERANEHVHQLWAALRGAKI